MSYRHNEKWFAVVLTPALAAAVLTWMVSGCGGSAYREDSSTVASNDQSSFDGGSSGNTNTGNTDTGNGSNQYSNTTVVSDGEFLPDMTFSFTITGVGGKKPTFTSPKINTDSVLKVRVTPGPAEQLSLKGEYSNFTANYGCISYRVTAIGSSVVTKTLAVGGYGNALCPQAPGEQVIDFSGRLTPGHGPVRIKVDQSRYDFYCQMFFTGWVYGSYNMFCPLKSVYKTHQVTGTLEIQVNGTADSE